MMEADKILTENECWYKFLRLPAKIAEKLPTLNARLTFKINGDNVRLLYLSKYKKVCGLTLWYQKYNLKKGDVIRLSTDGKVCEISIRTKSTAA